MSLIVGHVNAPYSGTLAQSWLKKVFGKSGKEWRPVTDGIIFNGKHSVEAQE